MKLCIITSGHDPFDGRVFHREIVSLKQVYRDVTIVAPFERAESWQEGVRILGFKPRQADGLLDRFRPLRELHRLAVSVDADVYHAHEPDSLLVGWWVKRRRKCKLIYDSHEYHPEQIGARYPGPAGPILQWGVAAVERYLARRTNAVFTVNEELVARFRSMGCVTELLPNYPPMEFGQDPSATFHGDSRRPLTGIWMGTIDDTRGLLELPEAVALTRAECRPFRIRIVGTGPSDIMERLRAAIRAHQVTDLFELIPAVPFSVLKGYLADSDFGLLLDKPYGFNLHAVANKVYEYMAFGLPVLVNDLPANRQLLEAEEIGVVTDPLSPEAVAASLRDLLSDTERLDQWGTRARAAFLERYNWQVVAGRMLKTYAAMEGSTC